MNFTSCFVFRFFSFFEHFEYSWKCRHCSIWHYYFYLIQIIIIKISMNRTKMMDVKLTFTSIHETCETHCFSLALLWAPLIVFQLVSLTADLFHFAPWLQVKNPPPSGQWLPLKCRPNRRTGCLMQCLALPWRSPGVWCHGELPPPPLSPLPPPSSRSVFYRTLVL